MSREWDCHCWMHYPNPLHKHKNGKWKCVDCYECIRDLVEPNTNYYDKATHCRRRTMGMTVERAINRLVLERDLIKLQLPLTQANVDFMAAVDVVIEAAEKCEKIDQIVKSPAFHIDASGCIDSDYEKIVRYNEIQEVLEDGNV